MSLPNNLNEAPLVPVSSSTSAISNAQASSASFPTASVSATSISYAITTSSRSSSDKLPEPTIKDIIDSGLDACCASFKLLDDNANLSSQLMYAHARALIEYTQLFLSQCHELNGKKIDLAERFENYLNKLQEEDDVVWLDYMKQIDRTPLREDPEVKTFKKLLFGQHYSALSGRIHTLNKNDLAQFSSALTQTKDQFFLRDCDKWKNLVNFLSKPGRFEASEEQKLRLIKLERI